MMQDKLRAVILVTIIVGFGFPIRRGEPACSPRIGSYAQEDSYKIMKLVRLRDGEAESVTKDSENLVEIRDSMGRDRTPEEGVEEGDRIIFGRYVHCGPGIGVALQANNDEAIWMNSDTTVQVKDRRIRADKGEVYTRAKRLELELTDGTVIDSGGNEFYLKAAKEESLLYLFKGEINLGSCILNKQKPFARISAGESQCLGPDRLPKDIQKRAEMWRKSIKRVTAPFWRKFWRKPMFYVPITLTVAVGTIVAAYYSTREPEVCIRIEMP